MLRFFYSLTKERTYVIHDALQEQSQNNLAVRDHIRKSANFGITFYIHVVLLKIIYIMGFYKNLRRFFKKPTPCEFMEN